MSDEGCSEFHYMIIVAEQICNNNISWENL